jgi:hypothetical protein
MQARRIRRRCRNRSGDRVRESQGHNAQVQAGRIDCDCHDILDTQDDSLTEAEYGHGLSEIEWYGKG